MDRLESLSQAAAANPNDAGIWLELGSALLELGAVDPAQHMVARARACEPASAQAWSSMGALLLRLGDHPGALEALRAATILDSEDRAAAVLFAKTAIEQGAADEAEDLLTRATCFGEDPVRLYLLALAGEAQSKLHAGLEYALAAIDRAPSPVFEHVAVAARLARRLGRHDIEERALLLLRQLDPHHVAHAVQLSDCLVRRGRTDLAVQELDRVGSGADVTPEEREQIGARFLDIGDTKRARAHLETAVAQRPNVASAGVLLGDALERDGDLDGAIAAFEAAMAVEPERPGVQARLGSSLLKAKRYAEAIPVLVKAVSEIPDNAELRAQLTRALLMSGDAETQPAREGSLSGDLAVFRVEELLEFLGVQRSTGKLHLTSNGRRGFVQIIQGKLIETRYPGRASLVTVLVARGLIPPARARMLPKDVVDDDGRLVRVLLDAGAVSERQLEAVMRSRIEQGVMHMLDWADGRARFEPQVISDTPMFSFEHQQILMSVMTKLDERRR